MPPNRLPIVDSDDGVWGDILRQYLMKEHVNDDTDNAANGGHRRITVQAGTTGAGTAPIKLTSGALMTSAEAGAIEFLTDTLYFTQSTGTTRKKIATYNDASGATGDIYYRDSSGYFTRLGIGSTGNILRVSGGLPNWFAPSYISATGMLEPVQAHTNGAETYTISAGTVTQIAGTSIHGGTYSPAVGDRILIATAPATSGTGTTNTLTTQPTNGIYTVTSNTTNLSVSRASDVSGSNHPAGLKVYSAAPAHSWRPNAVFTITTPQGPGSFTYGTNNIAFTTPRVTGDSLSINTATNSINIWNGTGSTALQPTASAGAQTLSLPATATSDTLVGRASTDTLTNKTLTAPVLSGTVTGTYTLGGTPTFPSAVVMTTGAQTLASKTLTAPIISTISNTGTLTLPTSTDTLVGRATTDTLTNKTLSGSNNTFSNIPQSAITGLGTDFSRLVCTTASGGIGVEDGPNTWAKIATFSTGTSQFSECQLLLSVTGVSSASHDTAIASVYFRSNSASQNPTVDVEILAKGGSGTLITNDSFKVISGAWSTDMELWFKKGSNYGKFNFYETSQNYAGGTLTYTTTPAWQSATPTGAVNNVSSNGVYSGLPLTANGTITAAQLISNVSTGTAPLTVASTTKVTNLNADLLDDMNATSALTGSTIMSRDSNGDTNVRYLMSTYVNMSHSAAARNSDTVFYSSTDAYIRKNTATGFKTSLALENVDNTSDATKNSAAVALTNKDLTSGTNTFPTFNQNTTGNAATATTATNQSGGTISATTGDFSTYARTNELRTLGGQQLVINAGEAHTQATGQTSEFVYINAESGVQINSSPDNWATSWAGRVTTTIDSSGITWNGNQVWHAGNDGSGSGLDADTLDGQQAAAFASSSHTHTATDISDSTAVGRSVLTAADAAAARTAIGAGTGSGDVTLTGAQNLTNKTLTAPILSGTVTGTYTLGGTPTFPSTVVMTTGAQTLASKTISGSSNTLTDIAMSSLATSGSATSSAYLRGDGAWADLNTLSSSLRANRNLSGGGTITVDGSGYVLWSARLIVIANGRGTNFSTGGYFDINCPTSGTITGVGGASNVTATAAGIPLAAWTALYYILPVGSGSGSLAANFRVVTYTADVNIPLDWVLICIRNGDNGTITFNNGISLALGQSMNSIQQSTSNTVNTLVRRDASGNFAAGVVTASQFTSNVSTGTAPLTVSSTTAVTNLNADMLDGQHAAAFASSSHTHTATNISDSTAVGRSVLTAVDAAAARTAIGAGTGNGDVTLTGAQTLTNKTLTSPIISSISNTGTLTLPTSTDTLVGRATTDTFTNKTFNANGTGNVLSNVEVADFAASAIITATETIAANNNDTTLPTSAAVKGYVDANAVTTSGVATLTNKTISGANNTITNLGVNLVGTFASLPAAGTVGRMYKCTDTDLTLFDNGSTWNRFGPTGPAFIAPPAAGWTELDTAAKATFTNDKGDRLLTMNGDLTTDLCAEYITLSPTSNYTVTAYIDAHFPLVDQVYSGLVIGQASTGEWITFGPSYYTGGGNLRLAYVAWTSATAASTIIYDDAASGDLQQMPSWIRIRDDNTDRFYEASYNGLDWYEVYSHARTTHLTADRVGFGMHSDSAAKTSYLRLRSWDIT